MAQIIARILAEATEIENASQIWKEELKKQTLKETNEWLGAPTNLFAADFEN